MLGRKTKGLGLKGVAQRSKIGKYIMTNLLWPIFQGGKKGLILKIILENKFILLKG